LRLDIEEERGGLIGFTQRNFLSSNFSSVQRREGREEKGERHW